MHDCGFVMDQLFEHGLRCDCAVFGGVLGAASLGLFFIFCEVVFPRLKKLIKRIKSKKKPDSQA